MAYYHKARVKLTNTQLNKLKSAANNKKRAILKMNQKKIHINNCHMIYF